MRPGFGTHLAQVGFFSPIHALRPALGDVSTAPIQVERATLFEGGACAAQRIAKGVGISPVVVDVPSARRSVSDRAQTRSSPYLANRSLS